MNLWAPLIQYWPLGAAVLVWAVSIERRLAIIQRDISWIKKTLENL